MSDNNGKKIRIEWLEDFYNWEWVDPKDQDHALSYEDYVNINGNIQLIRIDPGIAHQYMWVAKNINIFNNKENNGFKLYQCDAPSEMRKNIPLRFFYSKKYEKAFELKGNNHPFYDMFEFIYQNPSISQDILGKDIVDWFNPSNDNLEKYIRIFFDNVQGRHGRFEIVEPYQKKDGEIKKSYCLLYNRIVKFYERHPDEHSSVYHPDENLAFHQELLGYLNRKDNILFRHKYSHTVEIITRDSKIYGVWNSCHMIFKNSLFGVDVLVQTSGKNLGHISLFNEKQLTLADFKEKATDDTEQEGLNKDESPHDAIYLLTPDQLKFLRVNCID